MLFVVAFLVIMGLANWNGKIGSNIINVHADPALGPFEIKVDGNVVGDEDPPVRFVNDTMSITIKFDNPEDKPDGAEFEWELLGDDPAIPDIVEITYNDTDGLATIKRKSPGFANLALKVTLPGGTPSVLKTISVCVPLEWSDNVTFGTSFRNNILGSESNGYYGLINVNGTDPERTLQLYMEDSLSHPSKYHYLRKLKYVTYKYSDNRGSASVPSDIDEDDLGDIDTYLIWSSSDTTIVDVDENTGFITAKGVGIATVSVETRSEDLNGNREKIGFDVVVVPEAVVVGTNRINMSWADRPEYFAPDGDRIVIDTNVQRPHYASDLEWRVFRGEAPGTNNDITDELSENIIIGENGSTLTLENLKAGAYTVTAVPKKEGSDSFYDVVRTSPEYNYLGYRIIVPMEFPPSNVILTYDDNNVYDSYDLLSNSNLPSDLFVFSSENLSIVKAGLETGIIDARGEGRVNVNLRLTSQDAIQKYYGAYYNDTRIGYDFVGNEVKVIDVTVCQIALNAYNKKIRTGETFQLNLTAPTQYMNGVSWSSTNEAVCTVDESGLVTGVSEGTASVTAIILLENGVTKRVKCDIKVVNDVISVTLSPEVGFISIGDSILIEAVVNPESGSVALTWQSSNTAVADIVGTDTGTRWVMVKGLSRGSTIITAKDSENEIVESIVVTVSPVISRIELSETQVSVSQALNFYQLSASCDPELPANEKLRWTSSNPDVAKVEEYGNGKVEIVAPGSTTIRVTSTSTLSDAFAECSFTVLQEMEGVALTESSLTLHTGDTYRLSYTVNPSNTSNSTLKWSSTDSNIASVDESTGIITAKNPGMCVIKANAQDNSGVLATCTVTVLKDASNIKLKSSSIGIYVGESYYLDVEIDPEDSTDKITFESSNTKIATVAKNGKVTGVAAGNCIIMVRSTSGAYTYCNVYVYQKVIGLTLDYESAKLHIGEKLRLTAKVTPENASNGSIEWTSSDSNIATVDENGVITPKNAGTCIITAKTTDGSGAFATCFVTVLKNALDIKLDVASLDLNVGDTYQLDAKVEPADATDELFYESSNTKVAIVSANGKITAKGKGNCVVFVKSSTGNKYAYCYVYVSQQVEGLELTPEEIEIKVGELIELEAEISPDGASDTELEWTSKNEQIATVSQKGVVKGVSKGATIISCSTLDGEYVAICLVTVVEGNREVTITVNKSAIVGVGKTYQLTATVDGEEVPANTLKWKSSNKKICKVTKNGVIKGVKTGKCKITVKMKDGSIGYAKCTVKVITATNDIELNKSYVEIVQGRTLKLSATTSPKKTTYSPLWESSDETIATVSKKGTITAIKPGDCTIKCVAKDNPEVYATCRVHVTAPVNITSFNFSEEALVMVPGETSNIQYTVSPSNYTEGYTWSSDNPVAATVDSNGKVTARAVGTAKITALSNSGKKNTMNVYVVGLSKTKITLHQYESTKINLEVDGVKAGELDIRWDTDNQSIAEMSKGKVTGKALGTTTVYCVVNGRYLACTVKVIKN
jgi:uncharacterized protein YjdB